MNLMPCCSALGMMIELLTSLPTRRMDSLYRPALSTMELFMIDERSSTEGEGRDVDELPG